VAPEQALEPIQQLQAPHPRASLERHPAWPASAAARSHHRRPDQSLQPRLRLEHLTATALKGLAEFLPRWRLHAADAAFGVEAVCVAGGGEPLLNPATAEFIDALAAGGIHVGLVTNGTSILDNIDALSQCTWVGVSVDAATPATYRRLKGASATENTFTKVVDNIALLSDYSRSRYSTLGLSHPAHGISFKYLLYDSGNIAEIYQAAKLAKEIGCKNIHFRPAGTSWDKLDTDQEIAFRQQDVELFQEQVARALELDDDTFGVYGITHKFDSQFHRANYFSKCHAVFMTAVIMPPRDAADPADSLVVGLCCDRRGDPKLELAVLEDPTKLPALWGSRKHWAVHDEVVVKRQCPRCTYQPHNEVFEQVILRDSMTHRFI
jgi:hypothetical protein